MALLSNSRQYSRIIQLSAEIWKFLSELYNITYLSQALVWNCQNMPASDQIQYSDKYTDEKFEYRQVVQNFLDIYQ